MTLAAVWKFDDESDLIHAIADTRIGQSGTSNVLTEHGPKILPLTLVCKKPGPSGAFDTEVLRAEFGFAYSGSTLSALCTHALSNVLCQNLGGLPDAAIPPMDDIAAMIAKVALTYIREIESVFSAIFFGHCPVTGQSLAFELQPALNPGELVALNVTKHILDNANVVVINGGFPWLKVECSRCKTISSVDLAILQRPQDAPVHTLEAALRCRKCARAKWRPRGILHQLAPSQRHQRPEK
jgi:phage FluMu protein Com